MPTVQEARQYSQQIVQYTVCERPLAFNCQKWATYVSQSYGQDSTSQLPFMFYITDDIVSNSAGESGAVTNSGMQF